MAGFLDNLLSSNKKDTVYVSVTPGVGLEIIKVASDASSGVVTNYAHKALDYSETMRDIADYDKFKEALEELYSEVQVKHGSNVVLNMPNVYMGKSDIQLMLDDKAAEQVLLSEVEQSYLFKRTEPVISWVEVAANKGSDTRTLLYSALQKTSIDKIKEIITSLGSKLIRVDSSLISELRALQIGGYTSSLMNDGVAWNYLIVNSSGYSIAVMQGKNIIDYYEEPLALKTYEPAEIYDAINSSAQIALMGYPANYLFIVSNTDMVSAELLAKKISFEGQLGFLDNNGFKKQPIIPVDLSVLPDESPFISLQAVGIGASSFLDYPVNFNFLGAEAADSSESTFSFEYNGSTITVTEQQVNKFALILAIVIGFIPLLIGMVIMPKLVGSSQAKLDELNNQIQTVDAELEQFNKPKDDKPKFSAEEEMNNVLASNKTKLESYLALGRSVPRGLWITYFACDVDGEINITGQANDVESVYVFFKNMKDSMVESGLRLHKLELQSDSIDEVLSSTGSNIYNFEITNGSGVNSVSDEVSPDDSQNDNKPKKDKQSKQNSDDSSVENLEPVMMDN